MKKYWKKNRLILAAALILGILTSVSSAGISILLQKIVDAAVSRQTEVFEKLFLFAAGYILLLCVMNYVSALTAKYLTQRMIRQYRQDIFKGIMSRRPVRFQEENTADYISALTNDMKLVEDNYIAALLQTFELLVMFAATLIILLILSPLVTAILLTAFLLMFLIPAVIGRYLERRQELVSSQMAVFTEKLKDILSGYEVLKSYNRIEAANLRFQAENEKETQVRFSAARLFALNEGLSDTLAVISTLMVIFTGDLYGGLSGADRADNDGDAACTGTTEQYVYGAGHAVDAECPQDPEYEAGYWAVERIRGRFFCLGAAG